MWADSRAGIIPSSLVLAFFIGLSVGLFAIYVFLFFDKMLYDNRLSDVLIRLA